MNTHITVTNGKAFHEGVEIENFREIEIELDATTEYDYTNPKDGAYPLPEGWEVVEEYWRKSKVSPEYIKVDKRIYEDCRRCGDKTKVTARLIRKETERKQEEIDRLKKELEELKK